MGNTGETLNREKALDSARNRFQSFSNGWVWRIFPYGFAIIAALLSLGSVSENDLFFHIAVGDYFLKTGSVVGDPSWALAPVQPDWINTMVPMEVVFAKIYQWFGWGGFGVFRVACSVLLVAAIWFGFAAITSTKRSKISPIPARFASIGLVLLFTSMFFLLTVRPQSLIAPLTVLLGVWVVLILNEGKTPSWWLVGVVTWVWVLIHGSAIMVAPVLGLAFLAQAFIQHGEPWWRYLVSKWKVLSVALLAPLATPIGLGVWISGVRIKAAAGMYISEWKPPSLNDPLLMLIVFLALLWGFVLVQTWRKDGENRRKIGIQTLVFVILVGASIGMERLAYVLVPTLVFLVFANLINFPEVRESVGQFWERYNPRASSKKYATIVAGVAVAVVMVVAGVTTSLGGAGVPLRVWETIAGTPGEHRIFTDFNVSSEPLILVPDSKVYAYSPVDMFGKQVMENVVEFSWGKTSKLELLDQYQFTDVVLDRSSPKVKTLESLGWVKVVEDTKFVLLQKKI